MKLAFIMASANISGGSYVIFEHAGFLKKQGIDIYMLTQEKIPDKTISWYPAAKQFKWITFKNAQDITFDLVFATFWRTVYDLYKIKANKYAYYVQSIESRFYPENAVPLRMLITASYLTGIPIITSPKWIVKYFKENFNLRVPYVSNGIRKEIF